MAHVSKKKVCGKCTNQIVVGCKFLYMDETIEGDEKTESTSRWM